MQLLNAFLWFQRKMLCSLQNTTSKSLKIFLNYKNDWGVGGDKSSPRGQVIGVKISILVFLDTY